MENDLESKGILNSIIEKISENRVRQLLEIISKNYPTKFKYKDINTEVEYLKNHITFKPYKKKTVPATTPALLTPALPTPVLPKLQKETQCCARVWNNYIFDRTNMSKIKDLPELFKVNDFKKLNIKKFNSKYIIGLQCKKKKHENSSYCKLHINHLIHGDFTELPSKEICYHFMKDGKYLL